MPTEGVYLDHGGVLGPSLSGVGTDHPNVCYYSGIVWTSRLGHTYLLRPSLIIEPLPDLIPRHGPAPPLVIRPDDDPPPF